MGVIFPQLSLAVERHSPGSIGAQRQTSSAPARIAIDVALRGNGEFHGQILDPQGYALRGVPVGLQRNGKIVARTHTDEHGKFQFTGLRGGVYNIRAPGGGNTYRLWSPGTAPPSAREQVIVVSGALVRAQDAYYVPAEGELYNANEPIGDSVLQFLASPWFIGAVIAAAIAIPLAIDDDENQFAS